MRTSRWWTAPVAGACALLVAGCGGGTPVARPTTTTMGWGTTAAPRPAGAKGAAAAPALPTAASLVARAMANALATGWAHIDITTTSGGRTTTSSDDVGMASGQQAVTANGARAEARFVGGVAYARGDASSVTSYFGVPAPEAARMGGQWAAFSPDDAAFSTVAAGVSLSSVLTQDALTGPYRLGAPTVVNGQRVVPVSGIVSVTGRGPVGLGTLYITPGSGTVPVAFHIAESDGTTTDVSYSRWGAAFTLSAPPGAVPAASLIPPESATG